MLLNIKKIKLKQNKKEKKKDFFDYLFYYYYKYIIIKCQYFARFYLNLKL